MGDLFMSLIHTCELCGANPFDYLTELQRHEPELKRKPAVELSGHAATCGCVRAKPSPTIISSSVTFPQR